MQHYRNVLKVGQLYFYGRLNIELSRLTAAVVVVLLQQYRNLP